MNPNVTANANAGEAACNQVKSTNPKNFAPNNKRVIMLTGNIERNAIDSFVGGSDAGTIVTSIYNG
jgi:hypothetical protein